MILTEFTQEMTRRGCVADGKNFCGTYQGFPFSVLYMGGNRNKTQFSLRIQFASKVSGSMYRQARSAVKGLAKVQPAQSTAMLYNVLVTVNKGENFNQAFDTLMDASVNAARGLALAAPTECPLCKQPGCDAYAYHGASYKPVHNHCVQNQAATQAAKVENNELNGSYGLGIVGAVLGAIIGMIPIIILAALFQIVIYYSGILIPLGAYYGYKLLRGRMNKFALVATVVVSVISIPVLCYLMWSFMAYNEFGIFPSVALIVEAFLDEPSLWIGDVGIVALSVGLGVAFASGIISRTNKHVVGEANYSLATLRPMPGVVPPMPQPAPVPVQQQVPNQPMPQ